MKERKEIVVIDGKTGEIYGKKPRKVKRTEEFFMMTQDAAINLAKMKLTGMEHNVLLYLQGVADYKNVVPKITQAFLAKELNTTEATISVSIKGLIDNGIIRKQSILGTDHFIINPDISARGRLSTPENNKG